MSEEHGSVNVSRKVFLPVEEGGDALWNQPREFSEWEAWEYLFVRAAYAPHKRTLRNGDVVEIGRGETPPLAVRYLRLKWGWKSEKRVHSFLHRMIGWDRIRKHQETPDGNTYVVVNYERYQTRGNARETQLETAGKQPGNNKESSLHLHLQPEREAEEEKPMNAEQARVAMWAEFDRRLDATPNLTPLDRQKATATVRGVITGDTATAWHDQTGMPVPWAERPRLFRLALDERTANGGKLHNVLRQVVIPREFDPFPQRKSTDPVPGSEATKPHRELPGRERAPRAPETAPAGNYVPSQEETARKIRDLIGQATPRPLQIVRPGGKDADAA